MKCKAKMGECRTSSILQVLPLKYSLKALEYIETALSIQPDWVFVPEVMAVGLDLSRMERVNAKFHDRDCKRREGDVIWRMPTSDGEDVYLYVSIR